MCANISWCASGGGLVVVATTSTTSSRVTLASSTSSLPVGQLNARDRLVRGTLMFLLGALVTKLAKYALRRGLHRPPVVIGLVSFAIGSHGLFAAVLIDGFILPELAARFVDASQTPQAVVVTLLVSCGVAVNVSTAFGIAVLLGGSSLKPHTLMMVLGAQGVWYVCIAGLAGREA